MTATQIAPIERLTRSRWTGALVVVGVLLFVVRGVDRLLHPVLWAEDGAIFFPEQAMRGGIGALFTPYAGYLHTLPRAIAALVSPAPFAAAPVLYALTAVVLTLAVFAVVLSPRLTWLLPTSTIRAVAFALLCVTPVASEIYGNICNLIFVGGVGLVLIGLCDDPIRRWTRGLEALAVLVLATSGPLVVFVLPVMATRWWRNGRSAHSTAVLFVAVAGSIVQIAVYLTSARTTDGGGTLALILRALVERDAGGWLFGYHSLFDGGGGPPLTVAVAAGWLVVVLLVTVSVLRWDAVVLWLTLIALTAAPTLAYGDLFLANSLNGQRHVLTPVAIVMVLLVATAARAQPRAPRVVAIAAVALGAYAIVTSLVLFAHSAASDLGALQRCRESGAQVCSTPIAPAGFTAVLTR